MHSPPTLKLVIPKKHPCSDWTQSTPATTSGRGPFPHWLSCISVTSRPASSFLRVCCEWTSVCGERSRTREISCDRGKRTHRIHSDLQQAAFGPETHPTARWSLAILVVTRRQKLHRTLWASGKSTRPRPLRVFSQVCHIVINSRCNASARVRMPAWTRVDRERGRVPNWTPLRNHSGRARTDSREQPRMDTVGRAGIYTGVAQCFVCKYRNVISQ